MGASDIHLEPQEKGFFCRYRVDGILQNFVPLDKASQSAVISRIKIMANVDIAEKRLPQDGRVQLALEGRDVDLRVATFPTIYGEHVAIRILDKTKGVFKLEELGFSKEMLERFSQTLKKPFGFVLVTGPTGSGKTTTLYAGLNLVNDAQKNIITLEDPVEYSIANVHQSQVNVKAGLTFANGLRSIVRLDPDVIMIGEIRDKETAEIAIHASLTGHLVFSTLHTNDAPSAYTRLIDIGAEAYLASSAISVIVAQRLVRKLCPACKKEYSPSSEEMDLMNGSRKESRGKVTFFKEQGCPECRSTGYKGRTAIFELLAPNDAIRSLVLRKAPAQEIALAARESGMVTMREDGFDKVRAGVTSVAEVVRVTEED
jgi:type II secretory ATPase GspE/PulE/Tfp pilus assembly ATPase PilB-like protein